MKVQKKPVVIDAMEWTGENIDALREFSADKVAVAPDGVLQVQTNEGTMPCKIRDMILKAQSASIGEHVWPVDKGYFEENYTIVKEA